MITIIKDKNYKNNATNYKLLVEIRGLSSDTKPTTIDGIDICNGSLFFEIDTQDKYYYDEENSKWEGGGTVVINNQDITVTSNGEYTADEGYTGLGTVTVNVPERIKMNLNGVCFMQSPFITFPTGLIENGDWEHLTSAHQMFMSCENLYEIPATLDLSHVQNVSEMFYANESLVNIPELNISSATYISNMFYGLQQVPISDESMNNILKTCISATSFEGTKTLDEIGIQSWYYPSSDLPNLSAYQDFIDAGWTTGW